MATVGVLCSRKRVEERLMLDAVATAGLDADLIAPESEPVSMASGPAERPGANRKPQTEPFVLIDRCQNRALGSAIVRALRQQVSLIVDAGLAATETRLEIFQALSAEGIARPSTWLAPSEAAGLLALEQSGYPATLFPMQPGLAGISILDRDVAEAILEHRDTLGAASESVTLVQSGSYLDDELIRTIVVGGRVVAARCPALHTSKFSDACGVAECAARALGAPMIGVTLARAGSDFVVWDVHPVPDFRDYEATGKTTVAAEIAALILQRLQGTAAPLGGKLATLLEVAVQSQQEVAGGVALSA
jgi:hypothetical protein